MKRRALWGALALPALAEPPPTLRLSLLPYPGYFHREADGRHSGLDVDLAHELESRCACRFEILPTNTSRMWRDLQAGAVDLTAGLSFQAERLADADYLWLARAREVVLMSAAQAQLTPDRAAFDATPALKLGVLRGGKRGEQAQRWVEALRAQGRVSETADMPALLRAFDAGRLDAVLVFPGAGDPGRPPEWWAAHAMRDWLAQDGFRAGWAVSRRVPEALRRKLLDAGRAMREDGTLDRQLRQHLGAAAAPFYEFLRPDAR